VLQTQEELHSLKAAEAEIAIERGIERDAVGMRNSTKLPDESWRISRTRHSTSGAPIRL
jgi:hypothetical protein